ncbi:chemotaxis protein CheB (plasmid) [Rhizobium sp. CB3060]|uniref:chemotaxis protein CheB n=1 Tax=Rhizobium sp. CB3060 TaxID=3138255 RepID=UPI0021A5CEFB|nr:chemotaxis protein CheB [Rhizobium tropici]UWU23453.1 chemotaxis protein CheB [Rhizobium tropici]
MANRDIIVIGGSAGSSDPLRTILAALPHNLRAAVIIIVHIPANSTGILRLVTSASSNLPVKNAEDGEAILPGQIYLAPSDYHLLVIKDKLTLGNGPRENLARPSIDSLFRSAALSYGPRTIGVLLSGKMNDGASGLATIKQAGGVALVQAPEDAATPEMPMSALEATPVDLNATSEELARAIIHFSAEPPGPARPLPAGVRIEVEIAAGGRSDTSKIKQLADASPLTCPECGGVLSEVRDSQPLRFRCQIGHAYTAKALIAEQRDSVDVAMRVALRIVEERAALVDRLAKEATKANRLGMAEMHEERASEYRKHVDILRTAILQGMEDKAPNESGSEVVDLEMRAGRKPES